MRFSRLHALSRSVFKTMRGLRFGTLAVLLASSFVVSCGSDLSGPRLRPGYLALAPAFPHASAGIVDVDHLRVLLRRAADGSVALDTVIQMSPNDSVIDLTLTVRMTSSEETFWLTLECLTEGEEVVFEAGPTTVTATTSADVEPKSVEVEYVGVGYDAALVRIVTQEAVVAFGDTVLLVAEALDSSGADRDRDRVGE